MHLPITWQEIATRLLCAVVGGMLIGINRGEHGRAAGLRTTVLVCLAACIAMIEANLLLARAVGMSDSVVRLDFMRLPLGILTGVGFIGAGAILRRDNLVIGVTTAATLWFVTVMGLCFGGGQISLGWAAMGLGIFALWGLKWLERLWKEERHATMTLTLENPEVKKELFEMFISASYKIRVVAVALNEAKSCQLECQVSWRGKASDTYPPELLKQITERFHLTRLDWRLLEV